MHYVIMLNRPLRPQRSFPSLVLLVSLSACSGSQDGAVGGSGIGGAITGGGSVGVGGNAIASGGSQPSSGGTVSAKGGTTGTANGGSPAAGGVLATGGKAATGGAGVGGAVAATGGKAATGGSVATGGKAATGGAAIGGSATAGGKAATGGAIATGGAATTGGVSAGGKAATGGATATGGTTATGGASTGLSCSSALPAYTTSTTVSATITITGTKDYAMQRFCADPDTLGPGDQSESQKPIFMLAKGAVLKNVIIGGAGCSAADGVHCESGSCTLENVWFGDVGEDAVSFKGSDTSQVMTIRGGGAFSASDKIIQHNGPGTIKIDGFVIKTAGKLYRSCGNCGTQYARHVELSNIFASGVGVLAGINYNYGDTATINSLTRCGTVSTVCETFTGNDSGAEPTAKNSYTTSGDGTYCIFTAANIK